MLHDITWDIGEWLHSEILDIVFHQLGQRAFPNLVPFRFPGPTSIRPRQHGQWPGRMVAAVQKPQVAEGHNSENWALWTNDPIHMKWHDTYQGCWEVGSIPSWSFFRHLVSLLMLTGTKLKAIVKSCVPSSACNNGVTIINMGQTGRVATQVFCCVGDECRTMTPTCMLLLFSSFLSSLYLTTFN